MEFTDVLKCARLGDVFQDRAIDQNMIRRHEGRHQTERADHQQLFRGQQSSVELIPGATVRSKQQRFDQEQTKNRKSVDELDVKIGPEDKNQRKKPEQTRILFLARRSTRTSSIEKNRIVNNHGRGVMSGFIAASAHAVKITSTNRDKRANRTS